MSDPKRGRPPIQPGDPSVKVTISLPAKEYDRFCEMARQQNQSLPAAIRQAIYGNVFKELNPKK